MLIIWIHKQSLTMNHLKYCYIYCYHSIAQVDITSTTMEITTDPTTTTVTTTAPTTSVMTTIAPETTVTTTLMKSTTVPIIILIGTTVNPEVTRTNTTDQITTTVFTTSDILTPVDTSANPIKPSVETESASTASFYSVTQPTEHTTNNINPLINISTDQNVAETRTDNINTSFHKTTMVHPRSSVTEIAPYQGNSMPFWITLWYRIGIHIILMLHNMFLFYKDTNKLYSPLGIKRVHTSC